jgi:hypothetical protein
MNKINRIVFFVAMSMIALVCGIEIWRSLNSSENATIAGTSHDSETEASGDAKISRGSSDSKEQNVSDQLVGRTTEAEESDPLAEELDRERVRNASKIVVKQVARLKEIVDKLSDGPYLRELQDFMRPVFGQVDEKVIQMNKLTDGPLGRDERHQVRQIWSEITSKLALASNAIAEMNNIESGKNKEVERVLRNLNRR